MALRSIAELTPAELACRLIAEIATVLKINDEERRLSIEPWTTLLDLLRDKLDLIGTKKGATTDSAAHARCRSTACAPTRA
jgi:xanthine dehydrogenase iron-sulfur cluster and FAD-binding subunit A